MDKFKDLFKKIPDILKNTENINDCYKNLFAILKNVVDYESAAICYINSNNATVKYSINTKFEKPFVITEEIKPILYTEQSIAFDGKNIIAKTFNLNKEKHFLLSKLIIAGTVFGFILLQKDAEYGKEEKEVMKAFCAIASYAIKDNELSDVFKLQLKALQESIAEKARTNEIIKQQNEKILESDKIKSEFLANTSHELRTPLNAIIGFSEVLSKQLFGKLNEKQTEYVKDIHISGLHLLGMINEILEISKIESHALKLTPSIFDLNQSITEVINIVQPLADKKGLQLTKTLPEKGTMIRADYQKIQQILFNLLSNAIKFTPENGRIEAGYTANTNKVKIFVKDTGIGIAPKDHEKIFEKFVQLNNIYCKNESSTGLGLTITKELTELHKGKISIESEPEKGSIFTVELPVN